MKNPITEADEEFREKENNTSLLRLLKLTLGYHCKSCCFISTIILNIIFYIIFFLLIYFVIGFDSKLDYNMARLNPIKAFDEFLEINVYPINDVALFINESYANYSNARIRLTNDKREFDEGIKNSLSGKAYFNLENVENDQIIDYFYKSNRRKENYQKNVSLPFISAFLQTRNITVQQESGKLPRLEDNIENITFVCYLFFIFSVVFVIFVFGIFTECNFFWLFFTGINRCKVLSVNIITIMIYSVFSSLIETFILWSVKQFGEHNFLLILLLFLLPKIEKILLGFLIMIFSQYMIYNVLRTILFLILPNLFWAALFVLLMVCNSSIVYALSLFSSSVCQLSGFAALFEVGLRGYSLTFGNLDVGPYLSFRGFILASVIRIFIYFVLYAFFDLFFVRTPNNLSFYNICSLDCIKSYFSQPKEIKNFDPDAPFITVEDISKSYSVNTGKLYALNKNSFTIEQNEIIVLVGPDGCGKSTLIKSMTGICECDSGTLYLHGKKAESGFREIQRYLGISFHGNKFDYDETDFKDGMSIKNIYSYSIFEFCTKVLGISDIDVQNMLSLFELYNFPEMKIKEISWSQKRRFNVALAFFGSPKFVVLDEPTRGVGFASKQIIWKAISQLKNRKTIFITSRYLEEEAENIASRIFIMKSGNIINQGTPSKLRRDYKCGYKLTVTGSKVNMNELVSLCDKFTEDSELDEDENAIIIPESEDISDLLDQIEQMKTKLGIDDYTISLKRLSDVILRIVADEEYKETFKWDAEKKTVFFIQ